jgi:hypothetical protein
MPKVHCESVRHLGMAVDNWERIGLSLALNLHAAVLETGCAVVSRRPFGRVGADREDSSEVVDVSLPSRETADRAQPQLQALPVMVEALPDSFASTPAIPYQSIAMLVIIAAGAGVLAAFLQARRAGRLNVLDAISR